MAGGGGAMEPAPLEPPRLFPLRLVRTLALNSALSMPPAFNESRGYFPIEGDRLAAYELDTGKELWTVPARTQSRPAAGEGLVFIAQPEALAALRETDGSEAWRLPLTDRLAAPLVWDNGWLIASITSGTLVAIRSSDGEVIWRQDVGSEIRARPALAADRVYVGGADRVIALQVESGERLWERRLGGPANDMLALDDRIYVGSDDNFLYCLMARDGEIDWRWRTGGDVIGVPLADDHRIYFVSRDNLLRALDRRSGAQRWKRPLPLRPTVGPSRTQDLLIVTGVTPSVRLYQMKDGTPAGEISTDGDLAAAPYVLPKLDPPTFVAVARNISKGEMLTVVSRVSPPAPTEAPPTPAPPPVAGIK